jgi:hypothetical protein
MKVFQCPHYGKYFPTGNAIILFGFVQCLIAIGSHSLLSILYLGEHSSNANVTGVCVHDEPLSWLGVSRNRSSTQSFLERLESGIHL